MLSPTLFALAVTPLAQAADCPVPSPHHVATAAELISAIELAQNEVDCPGTDTIVLDAEIDLIESHLGSSGGLPDIFPGIRI